MWEFIKCFNLVYVFYSSFSSNSSDDEASAKCYVHVQRDDLSVELVVVLMM